MRELNKSINVFDTSASKYLVPNNTPIGYFVFEIENKIKDIYVS